MALDPSYQELINQLANATASRAKGLSARDINTLSDESLKKAMIDFIQKQSSGGKNTEQLIQSIMESIANRRLSASQVGDERLAEYLEDLTKYFSNLSTTVNLLNQNFSTLGKSAIDDFAKALLSIRTDLLPQLHREITAAALSQNKEALGTIFNTARFRTLMPDPGQLAREYSRTGKSIYTYTPVSSEEFTVVARGQASYGQQMAGTYRSLREIEPSKATKSLLNKYGVDTGEAEFSTVFRQGALRSLSNTSEALTSISDRVRSLSRQLSSGNVSASDREKIEKEIERLGQEYATLRKGAINIAEELSKEEGERAAAREKLKNTLGNSLLGMGRSIYSGLATASMNPFANIALDSMKVAFQVGSQITSAVSSVLKAENRGGGINIGGGFGGGGIGRGRGGGRSGRVDDGNNEGGSSRRNRERGTAARGAATATSAEIAKRRLTQEAGKRVGSAAATRIVGGAAARVAAGQLVGSAVPVIGNLAALGLTVGSLALDEDVRNLVRQGATELSKNATNFVNGLVNRLNTQKKAEENQSAAAKPPVDETQDPLKMMKYGAGFLAAAGILGNPAIRNLLAGPIAGAAGVAGGALAGFTNFYFQSLGQGASVYDSLYRQTLLMNMGQYRALGGTVTSAGVNALTRTGLADLGYSANEVLNYYGLVQRTSFNRNATRTVSAAGRIGQLAGLAPEEVLQTAAELSRLNVRSDTRGISGVYTALGGDRGQITAFSKVMADAFVQASRTLMLQAGGSSNPSNVLSMFGITRNLFMSQGGQLAEMARENPEIVTQSISSLNEFFRSGLRGNRFALGVSMRAGSTFLDMARGLQSPEQMQRLVTQIMLENNLGQYAVNGRLTRSGLEHAALIANQLNMAPDAFIGMVEGNLRGDFSSAYKKYQQEITGKDVSNKDVMRSAEYQQGVLKERATAELALSSVMEKNLTVLKNFNVAMNELGISVLNLGNKVFPDMLALVTGPIAYVASLIGSEGNRLNSILQMLNAVPQGGVSGMTSNVSIPIPNTPLQQMLNNQIQAQQANMSAAQQNTVNTTALKGGQFLAAGNSTSPLVLILPAGDVRVTNLQSLVSNMSTNNK